MLNVNYMSIKLGKNTMYNKNMLAKLCSMQLKTWHRL